MKPELIKIPPVVGYILTDKGVIYLTQQQADEYETGVLVIYQDMLVYRDKIKAVEVEYPYMEIPLNGQVITVPSKGKPLESLVLGDDDPARSESQSLDKLITTCKLAPPFEKWNNPEYKLNYDRISDSEGVVVKDPVYLSLEAPGAKELIDLLKKIYVEQYKTRSFNDFVTDAMSMCQEYLYHVDQLTSKTFNGNWSVVLYMQEQYWDLFRGHTIEIIRLYLKLHSIDGDKYELVRAKRNH